MLITLGTYKNYLSYLRNDIMTTHSTKLNSTENCRECWPLKCMSQNDSGLIEDHLNELKYFLINFWHGIRFIL